LSNGPQRVSGIIRFNRDTNPKLSWRKCRFRACPFAGFSSAQMNRAGREPVPETFKRRFLGRTEFLFSRNAGGTNQLALFFTGPIRDLMNSQTRDAGVLNVLSEISLEGARPSNFWGSAPRAVDRQTCGSGREGSFKTVDCFTYAKLLESQTLILSRVSSNTDSATRPRVSTPDRCQ